MYRTMVPRGEVMGVVSLLGEKKVADALGYVGQGWKHLECYMLDHDQLHSLSDLIAESFSSESPLN